ncbi:MAG TPA: cytochrome c oxidase assembly protein [Burkholderiales bacterium]|nr:cytochrome c oxidase assembly protein [Burkholderiales bacterium]
MGHGISDKDSFSASAAGMLVLATAALAPFDALLWSQMVQHELLMVVAAPLLVLGRPMVAFARIVPVRLPRGWASRSWRGRCCLWRRRRARRCISRSTRAFSRVRSSSGGWCSPGALGGGASRIGPPLERLAQRVYVAGRLANTPENLIRWIRDPRGVDPQTAMPAVGLDEAGVRDIAAYLYTR